MNRSPNRDKVLLGFDDDSYVNKVVDGVVRGPEPKRNNRLRSARRRSLSKPKGQHSYRKGLVK